MRKPVYSDSWPDTWKVAHAYNELELWGSRKNLGYTYAYHCRRNEITNAIIRLVPAGSKVLDIAAGQGNFTLPLAEQGYHMVWNDIRTEMEGYVKLRYESGKVDYAAGNCLDLVQRYAGQFDAIIATEIIEHVAHPDQFLKAIAQMLKPGGYIMLSTPNGKWLMNKLPRFSDFSNPEIFEASQFKPDVDGHIFLLHPDELKSLAAQAGLKMISFKLINSVVFSGNRHLARLLRFVPEWLATLSDSLLRKLPQPILEKITSAAIVVYQKP